jgi:protein involved in polysaccharide export with SLBB domain
LPVRVTSEANKPGLFEFKRRVRLSELVGLAGGLSQQAGDTIRVDHSVAASTCDNSEPLNSTASARDFEIVSVLDILRGAEKANLYLRPGDVVTVSRAGRVRVNGNVVWPGWVVHRTGLLLSQAIAVAGGYLKGTKADRIIVTRHPPGAASVVFEVNLKAIAKKRAPDVFLQPNDVVYVPGKRARGCCSGAHVFVVSLSVAQPAPRVIE